MPASPAVTPVSRPRPQHDDAAVACSAPCLLPPQEQVQPKRSYCHRKICCYCVPLDAVDDQRFIAPHPDFRGRLQRSFDATQTRIGSCRFWVLRSQTCSTGR